ncbi:MAG: hypothetical protein NTY22_04270 [Proteobacteria bacterium]|nr:hypothetical protein [Pseudomonadota bacterium]
MNFLMMLAISLSFFNIHASNQKTMDWDAIDIPTRDTLSLIANDNYREALESIDKIEKSDLPITIADCLRAALYYRITEEYRTRDFETDFDKAIKRSVDALSKEDKNKEKDPKYKAKRLQFLGSAYGYRGMYRVFTGLWGSAFLDGKRGYDALLDSFDLDNDLIDNKAGIGTYLYWRSAKAGFVKYLLFWGDRKQEGIADLKLAIEKGKIVKLWAMGGLLRIYMEEKKGTLSLELVDKILAIVPNDTGTMRKKAFVLEKMGQKQEAIKVYEQILPLVKSKDNIKLNGKALNTANVQIDTIYNILRLNKEIKGDVDKTSYKIEVEKLKKKITPSHFDIESYVEEIKGF